MSVIRNVVANILDFLFRAVAGFVWSKAGMSTEERMELADFEPQEADEEGEGEDPSSTSASSSTSSSTPPSSRP